MAQKLRDSARKSAAAPARPARERRKQTRVADTRKIYYQILKPRVGEGYTQNFSETGCCVLMNEQLPPGSVIELVFDLPGRKEQVRITGRVIWQDNYLTGIRFLTPYQMPAVAKERKG